MAPTRPRGVEDSRSETSSLITNLKDRSLLGPAGNSAVAKGKRVASNTQNTHPGLPSYAKNGTSGTATTPAESDQNTARIQWHTLHPSTLHTYRYAHNLPTASAYVHPHADIILTSSTTGLHSPSLVAARRKIREAKQLARRKGISISGVSKNKDRERSSDRLKNFTASNNNSTLVGKSNNALTGAECNVTHSQLASTVRRHFNSQQVSEGDVIAKFVYVVRHSNIPAKGGGAGVIGTEGSKILGIGAFEPEAGWEIGSRGREEDRRRDLGFRLRFKP